MLANIIPLLRMYVLVGETYNCIAFSRDHSTTLEQLLSISFATTEDHLYQSLRVIETGLLVDSQHKTGIQGNMEATFLIIKHF